MYVLNCLVTVLLLTTNTASYTKNHLAAAATFCSTSWVAAAARKKRLQKFLNEVKPPQRKLCRLNWTRTSLRGCKTKHKQLSLYRQISLCYALLYHLIRIIKLANYSQKRDSLRFLKKGLRVRLPTTPHLGSYAVKFY